MLTLLQPFNLDSSKDYTFANTTLGNLATANYYTGNGSLLSGVVASSANTAATVTTAAQPNITSVGTLTSLSVTGNASAGNIKTDNILYANGTAWSFSGTYSNSNVASYLPTYTGNVSSNYFIGNGSTLTYITGANVTGYVPNANLANTATSATTAGTITTNAQPNITSVGTLTSLTVTGNITTGNILGSNLSSANYFSGTDLTIAQLPITYSINFNGSNYANVTSGSGLLGSGDYTIEFWIRTTDGDNGIMVSNPAGASGHPAIFVSSNTLYFQRRYAVASTISADITSYLNNAWHHIAFVRGSGTISLYIDGTRITTASNSDDYSAVTAGLTFGWSPQTFNYLNGYLSNFRIVNGTALYSGATLTVPTSPLTAVSGTTLLVFQSSTLVDNSSSARALTSSGSPTISSSVTPFPGYIGTGNITSGNASLGNLTTSNYFSGNGSLLTSIAGANITGYVPLSTAANTAGTVTTAAQPNITSVGTLSSLSVTGNISANYFIGNGSTLSSVTGSNVYGNVDYAITSNWANTANSVSGTNVSGNVNSAVQSHYANIANSVSGSNVSGQVSNALIAGTVYTASQPNITSTGTLLGLSVTGNLDITGNINATGNLNYSNVTDLVVGDPLIYLGANNTGNLYDLGIVASYNDGTYYHTGLARDATDGTWKLFDDVVAEPTTTIDFANGTYAPFKSGEFVSTGNISGTNANLGNLVIANYFSGDGSLLTNINAGNITGAYSNTNVAAYLPTYTGNVSANYFIGDGSTLTSVAGANVSGYVPLATAANTAGTVTTAAQPNITSVGTLTGLTVSGLITATGTGIKTANVQDSTGTITITTRYGNISGDVGVYGNITAGTSGTGNVIATYFIGDGSQLTGISAGGATITDNTSANTTYYPVYATSNTGSFTTAGISTTKLQFNPSSGQLTVQDLNTLSDATLKTNQEVIDDPFTVLNQIFGMGFNWADTGKKSYGLMAQMLEKILPELVSENAQGKKTVNYIPIIAFLIEAVKKNQAEIEELKKDKYL